MGLIEHFFWNNFHNEFFSFFKKNGINMEVGFEALDENKKVCNQRWK